MTEINRNQYLNSALYLLERKPMNSLQAYLEFEAPTGELFAQARARFPNASGHCIEAWERHNLRREAVKQAFEGLFRIRLEGLATHIEGHAAAFLFKKTLKMYWEHLTCPSGINAVEISFQDWVTRVCHPLSDAFDSVFKSLTSDEREITKREKHVLLRAFWNTFEKAFNQFKETDPYHLAIVLFEVILKQAKVETPEIPATTTLGERDH